MQRLLAATRRARATLAVCTIASAALLSLAPGTALAGGYTSWGALSLPGHTWTSTGVLVPTLFYEFAEGETSSSICVGPVQKSSSGYVAPWGWKCQAHATAWEHANISAVAAVLNPNSGTIYDVRAYYAWH
jgi:hypothetical protein